MEEAEQLFTLETIHKREKKELQARIQALKKTMKNDKTKKKEITSEIAQLEIDLENKHKNEVKDIQNKMRNIHVNEIISDTPDEKPQKTSKAQKRRDKKQHLEKCREEEIKLQEKGNLHGPRNMEMQAIVAKLETKGLKIFPIPSDGDCLYKAVSHQLLILREINTSIDDLRLSVSRFMKDNKDDFLPFMSNPNTCEMLTDEEFEEYCEKITTTKVWGGQLEIRALSNHLKCPISIIQASGPDSIEQGSEFEGPPLVISYHRHMYSLGEHYNSTQKNNDTNS